MNRKWVFLVAAVLIVGGAGLFAYSTSLEGSYAFRVLECVDSSSDTSLGSGTYVRCSNTSDGGGFRFAGAVLLAAGVVTGVVGLALHLRQKSAAEGAGRTNTRPCPACAETVQAAAIVCRFCSTDLSPIPTEG